MTNGDLHEQEHRRIWERQERFQDQLEQLGGELRVFARSQVLMGENLGKMASHLEKLDNHLEKLDGHIEKIDLRLHEATEKLDALIDIVDRHARDDRRHN